MKLDDPCDPRIPCDACGSASVDVKEEEDVDEDVDEAVDVQGRLTWQWQGSADLSLSHTSRAFALDFRAPAYYRATRSLLNPCRSAFPLPSLTAET